MESIILNLNVSKKVKLREYEVDKEDLAGRNVFLMVALGLCAAVAPAC